MRAPADRERLDAFLRALGASGRSPIRLYLVGGAVMVDLGLRQATLDVDYVARGEASALRELERALPKLKDELDINVEPASPADFMPIPDGVLDQSAYVRSYGQLAVYHYHYPSLTLAKIARGAERDLVDVELLVRHGIVSWPEVEQMWERIRGIETGWLRQTPLEVDRRLQVMRNRLRDAGLIPRPASQDSDG